MGRRRRDERIIGRGDSDPRAYENKYEVPIMDTDIYQCPHCGETTASLSEEEQITCKRCRQPYFRAEARLVDNTIEEEEYEV